jgi:hypothetical protein
MNQEMRADLVLDFLKAFDAWRDYVAEELQDDYEMATFEQLQELARLENAMFTAREKLL